LFHPPAGESSFCTCLCVCAGGSCSTKCGTVYFFCAIYTKSLNDTQNWKVAVRSCVGHRSCSMDLDETWNWNYTLNFFITRWNPIATLNSRLLHLGPMLVRSIQIGDISKNVRCIIKVILLGAESFVFQVAIQKLKD
jgi:hypothetical protein